MNTAVSNHNELNTQLQLLNNTVPIW